MWKIFDVVPGVVWAALCAALVVATGFSYVRLKNAQAEVFRVEAQFSTYKAEVAENTRKAEAEARIKEQAMQRQSERVANEVAKKQSVLAARASTTELVAGQLRDEIARLNSRPAPTDPSIAAIAREASTARKLLGTCSTEYRGVAQGADSLRDQVTGLQDFIAAICTTKQP